MKKPVFKCAVPLLAIAGLAFGQTLTESAAIGGKTIAITYSSPKVNGRAGKLFGKDGRIGKDPTYPVWRAGANAATKFHTDADLDVGGLSVPKGDYTLYVDLTDPAKWQLVINKQTGQWGLTYNKGQDLGRVPMSVAKPDAPIEELKYTLSAEGGNKGKLTLAWENVTASVPITVKYRGEGANPCGIRESRKSGVRSQDGGGGCDRTTRNDGTIYRTGRWHWH